MVLGLTLKSLIHIELILVYDVRKGSSFSFLHMDLEIEIPFDTAIPLLGLYPKNYKSFYYKDTYTRMFTAALFTRAKTWKTNPNVHQ